MARPMKTGLDYFPLDTSWKMNMKLLKAKFGLVGIGCMVELYRTIYREGYSLKWDEDTKLLFSSEHGIQLQNLEQIVYFAIKKGIFSEHVFDVFGILTSRGIQSRWVKIVALSHRAATEIDHHLNLLVSGDEFPTEETEFPTEETPFPTGESTQSKVKESKVNINILHQNENTGEPDLCIKNPVVPFDEEIQTAFVSLPPDPEKAKPQKRDEELFNGFWEEYPRKVQKQDARKAFATCIKEKQNPADILKAAQNYKSFCEEKGVEEQFVKHPATFLRNERWKDWLEIKQSETIEEQTRRRLAAMRLS